MRGFRRVTVGVLVACALAGCSRSQPEPTSAAGAPAASDPPCSASTPAEVTPNGPPTTSTARVPARRQIDPERVKVYSMLFVLDYAVDKYHKANHEFPASLDQVVNASEALLDPWGRPYHYDRAGTHSNGQYPDIWSEGPDPNDPHAVLANWDQVTD